MSEAIAFVATCPICKRTQLQEGFTYTVLEKLLKGGYPIEAHCEGCGLCWPVSIQQRVELGRVITGHLRKRLDALV